MDASQKTSSITILVRLGACAAIGVGIVLLLMGLFMSHGTATMCLAGILVIGFAVLLLEMNPRAPDDDALVEIYLASNSHQAHFLRNMLADAGIETRIFGELSTLGVRPGEESGPCLWARRRDRDRAQDILEDWEKTTAAQRADEPEGFR